MTIAAAPDQPADTLSVFRAIGDSYGAVFRKPARLLRRSWLFLAGALPLNVAILAAPETGLAPYAIKAAWILLFIGFAFTWQRSMLLGAATGDRLRDFARFALPSVLLAAAAAGIDAMLAAGRSSGFLSVFAVVTIWWACAYVGIRLSPMLPAAAVGRPLGPAASWRLMPTFASVRAWIGAILLMVPLRVGFPLVGALVALAINPEGLTDTSKAVIVLTSDPVYWILQTALVSGYQASLYRQLGGTIPDVGAAPAR